MLVIEAKRVLKDSLVIFLVLAAIVAGIIASDQDIYLAPALELFLLLYASFAGWSMFERERQENAGEYMLSLPLSRSRLLLLKFLPRLLSVSLVLLIYLRLHQHLRLPSFLPLFDFAVLYSGFFLVAIAFSICFRNFISAFFIICLLTVGQVLLILLLDPGREIASAIRQATLAVLALPLLFFILFQSYDIRPISHFSKKFFPGLLLISGLIAGGTFLAAPPGWKNLYLTHGGMLLKHSCTTSEIELPDGRRRLPGCLIALRETDDSGTLFGLTRKPGSNGCMDMALVTLDLKNGDIKKLYSFAPDWSIPAGHAGEIGSFRHGTYSLLLLNAKAKKAMLLRVHDGQANEFPVAGSFYDADISYVLYPGDSPLQVVIFSRSRLYRLEISGRVQELAQSDSLSVWQDRMLLFGPTGVSLYQVGKEMTLLWHKAGPYKKSVRRISGFESRATIYHLGRDYFWLDMELQKENKLAVKFPPYTYQQSGENFNVVFANGSVFTIREIKAGKQSETIWAAGFQPSGIRISPFGFLVFKDQKYKVYPFKN
jgi:ABC-type transport system involved in multi-copper enzyme maturation permease subunit